MEPSSSLKHLAALGATRGRTSVLIRHTKSNLQAVHPQTYEPQNWSSYERNGSLKYRLGVSCRFKIMVCFWNLPILLLIGPCKIRLCTIHSCVLVALSVFLYDAGGIKILYYLANERKTRGKTSSTIWHVNSGKLKYIHIRFRIKPLALVGSLGSLRNLTILYIDITLRKVIKVTIILTCLLVPSPQTVTLTRKQYTVRVLVVSAIWD